MKKYITNWTHYCLFCKYFVDLQ